MNKVKAELESVKIRREIKKIDEDIEILRSRKQGLSTSLQTLRDTSEWSVSCWNQSDIPSISPNRRYFQIRSLQILQ